MARLKSEFQSFIVRHSNKSLAIWYDAVTSSTVVPVDFPAISCPDSNQIHKIEVFPVSTGG